MLYQCYEEWDRESGDIEESFMWETLPNIIVDFFFPQELRKVMVEEFVNLRQGKISVKQYALKFYQLSRYS